MTDVQDQSPVAGAVPPPETVPTQVLSFRNGTLYDGPVASLADFSAASNTAAVRIDPGDDVRALIPHLGGLRLIEVAFPKYRDGRGYSSARILREAGYTGELRAQGDVLVDQMPLMQRCGFDSFAPESEIDPATLEASLKRYENVYQKAADGRVPIWARRHG